MSRNGAWFSGWDFTFYTAFLQHIDLLYALAANVAFFLLCMLCRYAWRWKCFHRCCHSRDYADTPYLELNATAENYILFLRTGSVMFFVLFFISVPATLAVWGPMPVLGLVDTTSASRIVFNRTGLCGTPQGFGELVGSDAAGVSSQRLEARTDHSVPQGFSWRTSGGGAAGNANGVSSDCRKRLPRQHPYAAKDVNVEYGDSQSELSAVPQAPHPPLHPHAELLFSGQKTTPYYAGNLSAGDCVSLARGCSAAGLALGVRPATRDECWLLWDPGEVNITGLEYNPNYSVCYGEWDSVPGRVEFGLTLVYGIVVIAFAFRFLFQLYSRNTSRIQRHTVWLTHLPSRDRETGARFQLEGPEFRRVGQDLKRELTKWIKARWSDEFDGEILDESREGAIIEEVYVVHAGDGMDYLAGHAFAVLSKEVYVRLLLHRRGPLPGWCHWRDHTLFKFGMPPWAAVTLRCQRAPPPSDIAWENLHIASRAFASIVMRIMLFVFVLIVSAPDLSRVLTPWFASLHDEGMISEEVRDRLTTLCDQLPSLLLLLMNSLLLPIIIELISDAQRPHLKSQSQTTQFLLNLTFLCMTSIVVPCLHLLMGNNSLLNQLLDFYHNNVDKAESWWVNSIAIIRSVGDQAFHLPLFFLQKYLMNATFFSNGFQLIQFSNGLARRFGFAESLPFPYAWGYWYAWSMSIIYLGLITSVVMPSMLPLCALFFIFTCKVHEVNLRRGAYESNEMDRFFESRIAASMIQAVAAFWWTMALYFFVQDSGDMQVQEGLVHELYVPLVTLIEGTPSISVGTADISERLVVSGSLLFLAFLSALGSLLAVRGWLEELLFHRLGGQGPDHIVCLFGFMTIPLLVGAFLWMPNMSWSLGRIEMPEHSVFALILFIFGVCGRLLARATVCVQSRRTRLAGEVKISQDKFVSYGQEDFVRDLAASLRKEGEVTVEALVKNASWYRPPTRLQSGQLLQQTSDGEIRQLLSVAEEDSSDVGGSSDDSYTA
eukprot:TRINITY_DN14696_c1_g4_i1.p1 TRINITY_DN14696_c1_g4~~TRINITY_DN14696_c1_g4_i1.p1  ORF type:complete len:998 (-),score=185.12 TRINITY_DN14696_c1_g4_i1:65-3058(-)